MVPKEFVGLAQPWTRERFRKTEKNRRAFKDFPATVIPV
jgi:hypothetical protein